MTNNRTWIIGLGVVLAFFATITAVTGFRFLSFLAEAPQAGGTEPRVVFYEVKGKESPMTIARELEKEGIVTNARLFYWYGRLTGRTKKIKSGDYRLTAAMRPHEVMAIITSGVSYGMPLTVPEGYNMQQVAEALEALKPGSGERFLGLCSDREFISSLGIPGALATLEGYLFPDTYLVGRKTTEEEIIHSMVKKFKATFTPDFEKRAREIGMTEHQVITLASIIEKETGAKEERPMISSVFHNRLKKHMRLQSDPTVVYGIKNYDGNITRKHLETPTPYNTYTIPALPPGPISNPGALAIRAALYPVESKFLYFVSHNDGTHEFTATYEDHKKAVAHFQLDPHAREGKSWRDLSRRQASDSLPRSATHKN